MKKKNQCALEQRQAPWQVRIKRDWQIYVLLLPAIVYLFMFDYIPMYGIQIAFKDFVAVKGIWGSPWIGFQNFINFFHSYYWKRLIINTFLIQIYGIFWGFPVPIILALMLNQLKSRYFKGFVQTVLYAPHFISVVVLAGMLYIFLSPVSGLVNKAIVALGGNAIFFLNDARWFRTIFTASSIWQGAGWSAILYIAQLSNVDPELYEAATIDGAGRLAKMWYIDIPTLTPIVTMQLILSAGGLLRSEFQKTLLLQNPGNIATSDTIGVYVFNVGLAGGEYSFSAAIGLMLNLINIVIMWIVNKIANMINNSGIW